MKICKYIFFLFLCFVSFKAQSAQLNLQLDKNEMVEGDILYLTLSYTDADNQSPDLTALKKDFTIVSNGYSSQSIFRNGIFTESKTLKLGLQPLKLGKIEIKPIKIGSMISNYAEVMVHPVSDVAFVQNQEPTSPYFKIEQFIDNKKPYVKQQINLTVKIYDSLGLNRGVVIFSDEDLKKWSIINLSENPSTKTEIISGRKMNVYIFKFALFPQIAGVKELPQASFNGEYIKDVTLNDDIFSRNFSGLRINFDDVFGQKEPVKMRATTEKINIQSSVNNIPLSSWLPLSNLTIDYVKLNQNDFQIGDAINKKIVVQAYGIQKDDFPGLSFPEVDGFKMYPEKPITSQKIIDGQVVTTAEINTVYIPNKSGTLTFPKLEIEWFDVNKNMVKHAIVPEETIVVISDKKETNIISEKKQKDNTSTLQNVSQPFSKIKDTSQPFLKINHSNKIVLSVIGIIILVFILFFMENKKHYNRNMVISNIKRRNYTEAKKFLLIWAQKKYKNDNIKNFKDIEKFSKNDTFSAQLNALNKHIYSTPDDFFDNGEFIRIFKKTDKIKIKLNKKSTILPNLYD